VSDRLYLSCWLRPSDQIGGFDQTNLLRQFGTMLELFPFSKLARRGPLLRIYAIEHAEPPLFEREFPIGAKPDAILAAASEFAKEDCTCQVETFWDLWERDEDWRLGPASITLACFGPDFENEHDDDLRIEFGLDARFLPQPWVAGSPRMVQSNIRSLLHLVGDLERALDLERRQVWSESGANFAEVLKQALGTQHVN